MRIPASLAALGALLLLLAPPRASAQNVEAPTMMGVDEAPTDPGDAAEQPSPDGEEGAPAHRTRSRHSRSGKEASPEGRLESPKAGDDAPPQTSPAAVPQVKERPAAASPAPTSAREKLKQILTVKATDADLVQAWDRWRKATAEMRPAEAEAAQKELLGLREDLGARDLEDFSIGFVRASRVREKEKDALGAVTLAKIAVELAPELPYAHLGLAHAYFYSDPISPGRYTEELWVAGKAALSDPRYARPIAADVGASALLALLGTATLTVLLLFLRRARSLFHDVHHLFPAAARRWQSAAVAVLLLSLPLVFRLGLTPFLLVLFAAVSFHLSARERLVGAVMLALLGVVPTAAGWLAARTAFAGTVAEDVYLLERGGLLAKDAAVRIQERVGENRAEFAEQFALARYLGRRGKLPEAIALYKQAATQKNGDARLLTNLGNAVLAQGDEDGAAELYLEATQADPTLAAAFYDLSKVYYRRAAVASDEQVGPELDRAQSALSTAQRLDHALLSRQDPPADRYLANRLLLSPGLTPREVVTLADDAHGQKITRQLSSRILGEVSPLTAAAYPAGAALLLLFLGWARRGRGVSKPCDKCGRAVCRRCDPELGLGSTLCNQCVHVFARKGAVPGAVKVRKQIEIRRYQQARDRLSYAFAAVCSGLGHLFSGLPVRGAVHAFLFLFGLSCVFLRDGVLRPPYGPAPLWLTMVPVGLLIGLVYFLSLRGLYRRQAE